MKYDKTHKNSVVPTKLTKVPSEIKLVQVDLDKRGYIVEATGSVSDEVPMVYLTKTTEKGGTLIEFPEYKGWDIAVASTTKYTLSICFKKIDD
jgi:hypothetical protein